MTRTTTAESGTVPRRELPSLRPLADAEIDEPVVGTGSWDPLLRRDFAEACREVDGWPLPGRGNTELRLELLARVSARDLVLGRLVEAHADAVAILHELRADVDLAAAGASRRWGVWAAGPPGGVVASHGVDGWRVSGTKRWCSGAGLVTHVLLDAASPDGQRLFEVDLSHHGVTRAGSDWTGAGMGRADTRRVDFLDVPARAVGGPGEICPVRVSGQGRSVSPPVGTGERSRWRTPCVPPPRRKRIPTSWSTWERSTRRSSKTGRHSGSRPGPSMHNPPAISPFSRAVRFTVERNAVAVIDRVGRALGPRPLAYDELHARAVLDLQVYIRQDHAERDLERLGRDVVEGDVSWSV